MQTLTSLTFFTAIFVALGGALAEELMICCRHVRTELYYIDIIGLSFFLLLYLRNLFCRPDCQLKSVDISLTGALLPLRLLSVSVSTADAQRASTATGAAASVSDAISGLGGVSGLRESTETDGVTLKSWLVCIMFQRRRILHPVYSNSISAVATGQGSNPRRRTIGIIESRPRDQKNR